MYDTKGKLQLILHRFNKAEDLYIMRVSIEKSTRVEADSAGCVFYLYFEVTITTTNNLSEEVKVEVMKGSRISNLKTFNEKINSIRITKKK